MSINSGKSSALDLAIRSDACSTVLTLLWILESLRDARWSALSTLSVGSSNQTTLRPEYTGEYYATDKFDFTNAFRIRWPDSPFVFDLPGGTGHTVCPNTSLSQIVFSKRPLLDPALKSVSIPAHKALEIHPDKNKQNISQNEFTTEHGRIHDCDTKTVGALSSDHYR